MLFSIGTKVRLLQSGEFGKVVELLDQQMVLVELEEDGLEIPVFLENLEPAAAFYDTRPGTKSKIVPGKRPVNQESPPPPNPHAEYFILSSMGIQLAFDPVLRPDATAESYRIFLINDTHQDVLFTIQLQLQQEAIFKKHGKLPGPGLEEVGKLYYDELNEQPIFTIECRALRTDGTGPKQEQQLRIKPARFFKSVRTAPLLDRQVHHYIVFEQIDTERPSPKEQKEDLQTYTQRLARTKPHQVQAIRRLLPHEVEEMAHFSPEIDLHIEALTDYSGSMKPADILHLQLVQFERYIDRAIRLGVDRVFVIHGLGKGRLRDAIATRLLQTPHVKTFKNEYHPRYGYGATEVIFE